MCPKREVRSVKDVEGFGDLAKLRCISCDTSYQIKFIIKWISKNYEPKFVLVTKVFSISNLFQLHSMHNREIVW
jgi:hypothetical protein